MQRYFYLLAFCCSFHILSASTSSFASMPPYTKNFHFLDGSRDQLIFQGDSEKYENLSRNFPCLNGLSETEILQEEQNIPPNKYAIALMFEGYVLHANQTKYDFALVTNLYECCGLFMHSPSQGAIFAHIPPHTSFDSTKRLIKPFIGLTDVTTTIISSWRTSYLNLLVGMLRKNGFIPSITVNDVIETYSKDKKKTYRTFDQTKLDFTTHHQSSLKICLRQHAYETTMQAAYQLSVTEPHDIAMNIKTGLLFQPQTSALDANTPPHDLLQLKQEDFLTRKSAVRKKIQSVLDDSSVQFDLTILN